MPGEGGRRGEKAPSAVRARCVSPGGGRGGGCRDRGRLTDAGSGGPLGGEPWHNHPPTHTRAHTHTPPGVTRGLRGSGSAPARPPGYVRPRGGEWLRAGGGELPSASRRRWCGRCLTVIYYFLLLGVCVCVCERGVGRLRGRWAARGAAPPSGGAGGRGRRVSAPIAMLAARRGRAAGRPGAGVTGRGGGETGGWGGGRGVCAGLGVVKTCPPSARYSRGSVRSYGLYTRF